jgi:hypothetical protein
MSDMKVIKNIFNFTCSIALTLGIIYIVYKSMLIVY